MRPRVLIGRRTTLQRWLRFTLVGAAGILVQLGALHVLTSCLRAHYLLATTLAVEVAVLHNFVWHERLTWRDRSPSTAGGVLGRLLRFNLTTGTISVGGNLGLMSLLVEQWELPFLLANLVTIGCCSLFNFLACDRFVFRAATSTRVAWS